MRQLRLAMGAGLVLVFASAAAVPLAASQTPPGASAAPSPPPAAVDPAAIAALSRMSAYLKTLTAFEITAKTSQDLVTDDGQKVKLDGVNRYLVRRPDAFWVEVATDHRVRQLTYDGKQLTLFAPELGFYGTVDAPATIRETMAAAEARFGLAVPLADLFVWTDPSQNDRPAPETATLIGSAKVDGVECDHFAFREADVDWQIWIQRDDKPVPRKIVIIDRTQATLPEYEATLTWNMSPALTADTFTFRPADGAKPIRLATLESQ